MLAEYALRQFYESQGLLKTHPCFTGHEGADLQARVRDRLTKAASRLYREWTSVDQPAASEGVVEPWWTFEERRCLEDVKESCWERGFPFLQKCYWPEGKSFAAIVTHDVDVLHPLVEFSTARLVARLLREKAVLLRHRPCRRQLERVALRDSRLGIPATFFFMTQYDCADGEDLSTILRRVATLGFEVGLHASEGCRSDAVRLKTEKTKLESLLGTSVQGVRHHLLSFDPSVTWHHQGQAEFAYDSSFAWNGTAGFRSGSALPIRCFDFASNGTGDLLELPMSYMDWTDLHRGSGVGGMRRTLSTLLGMVQDVNGVLTLNFHNSYLNDSSHHDVVQVVLETLGRLKQLDAWIATGGQCTAWWNRRSLAPVNILESAGNLVVQGSEGVPLYAWYPDQSAPRILRETLARVEARPARE